MKQKKPEKLKSQKQHGPEKAEDLLNEQLELLQKEKDDLFAQLQRVSADYTNFQKRVPKQIADSIAYEKERIIKTLLPALDNFEHTLQNANSTETSDILLEGIRIIYDQTLDILKSHGVEQIKALDEKFDPVLHQAMMQKTEPDKAENIILEEFQKGYRLNGRVIRPSKVIVNKLKPEQEQTTDESQENQTQ
ncbi:MAG: nucleotide exchange factor GrpE [Planctomycetota bacterium]|jgi:molecular chaperone GrpE